MLIKIMLLSYHHLGADIILINYLLYIGYQSNDFISGWEEHYVAWSLKHKTRRLHDSDTPESAHHRREAIRLYTQIKRPRGVSAWRGNSMPAFQLHSRWYAFNEFSFIMRMCARISRSKLMFCSRNRKVLLQRVLHGSLKRTVQED